VKQLKFFYVSFKRSRVFWLLDIFLFFSSIVYVDVYVYGSSWSEFLKINKKWKAIHNSIVRPLDVRVINITALSVGTWAVNNFMYAVVLANHADRKYAGIAADRHEYQLWTVC